MAWIVCGNHLNYGKFSFFGPGVRMTPFPLSIEHLHKIRLCWTCYRSRSWCSIILFFVCFIIGLKMVGFRLCHFRPSWSRELHCILLADQSGNLRWRKFGAAKLMANQCLRCDATRSDSGSFFWNMDLKECLLYVDYCYTNGKISFYMLLACWANKLCFELCD